MHSLLERYLSEVAVHLGPMPVKRRNEELREMRAHLEAAAAAQCELGQSEEDAMRNALVQFGTPDALGQSAVAAWRRGVRRDWRDLASAAALTFALMLATHLVMRWCSAVHSNAFMHSSPFMAGLRVSEINASFLFCSVLYPRRAVLGVQIGFALFFAAFFGMFHLNYDEVVIDCILGPAFAWLAVRYIPQTARKQQTLR